MIYLLYIHICIYTSIYRRTHFSQKIVSFFIVVECVSHNLFRDFYGPTILTQLLKYQNTKSILITTTKITVLLSDTLIYKSVYTSRASVQWWENSSEVSPYEGTEFLNCSSLGSVCISTIFLVIFANNMLLSAMRSSQRYPQFFVT